MQKSSAVSLQDLTKDPMPINKTQKEVCCICNMMCAPFDKGVYRFTTPDGNKVSFCYQHLLDIVKRDKSLPDVPSKVSDFSLTEFIENTKIFLEKNNGQTIVFKKFLEKTKLDNFIEVLVQETQQT